MALFEGKTVDLAFDEQLCGWRTYAGSWKRIDERTIVGKADPVLGLLVMPFDAGDRWEIRGKFRDEGEKPREVTGVRFGPIGFYHWTPDDGPRWLSLVIRGNRALAWFDINSAPIANANVKPFPVPTDGDNEFRLGWCDKHVYGIVNNRLMNMAERFDATTRGSPGLFVARTFGESRQIVFHDLKIRRIDAIPELPPRVDGDREPKRP